ncbi:MAG: hypothetical protein RIT81_20700 [Deltaproteobacteria bacterium]
MMRFVPHLAVGLVALIAACDTGVPPEELYYGPKGKRLAPQPFPPGPEGPWLQTRASGEPRDDGVLFDRGTLCVVDLDEDPYEQFTVDCECGGSYTFRDGFVELRLDGGNVAATAPYELRDNGTVLAFGELGEATRFDLLQGAPDDFELLVRPTKMFTIEDCRGDLNRRVVIVTGP